MMHGVPVYSLGLGACSGWMNTKLYARTFSYFVGYVVASKDNPCLLG